MIFYKANQSYNASLTSDYTVSDTALGVNTVPSNTPTIVTVARGTAKQTRFYVTGTSGGNQLTGVTRLDGANENIPAGSSVECMNDEDFINQLSSVIFDQAGLKGIVYAADGGSTDDYEITLPVAPASLTDIIGVPIAFKANTANTGVAKLTINGLAQKTIKKQTDQDLDTGDIKAGQICVVIYDGTNFQITAAYNGGDLNLTGTNPNIQVAGADPKRALYIPANGMFGATTNGAATGQVESSTNKVNFKVLDFDKDTDEYACFTIPAPLYWDLSTVTAQYFWTNSSGGSASETVKWYCQAVALSNDDATDTAYGTAVGVEDALIAASDVHVTSASSAITVGGTPAANDWLAFRIYRDVSEDTLAGDARLIGVRIEFGISKYDDKA